MSESSEDPGTSEAPAPALRVVLLPGTRRTGAHAVLDTLTQFDIATPQQARWLATFHAKVFELAGVVPTDARPQAAFLLANTGSQPDLREEARAWLRRQLDVQPQLLLHEPRIAFLASFWREIVISCDAGPGFVGVQRPPADIAHGAQPSGPLSDAGHLASWLNAQLTYERSTRDQPRSFLLYDDLLDDWTGPIMRLGQALDLPAVLECGPQGIRRVHHTLAEQAPLPTSPVPLAESEAPTALVDLCAQAWAALQALTADPADAAAEAALDDVAEGYRLLYLEAEAVARSSINAAREAGKAFVRSQAADAGAAATAPAAPVKPAVPEPPRATRRWARRSRA
ncbi:MAG TPA: hypothetical protein VGJ41_08005 [Nocardioides sp.]